MWTRSDVLSALKKADAHRRLLERKITLVSGCKEWLNGYEYGVFMEEDTCLLLAETMQIQGFLLDDVVSPFVVHTAHVLGYRKQILNMKNIHWSVPVIKGLMRRPDIHFLLANRYGSFNGYEYALLHDFELSVNIGCLIRHNDMMINKCIRYSVFKQSPKQNIKAIMLS